ncbi:MAG: helix-turn-helix transcriptional regulator [Peptococcaceae bacterium]|nr:helix-turn-helix transcriptional regulator [Peptococcaceae bacterium]
MKIYAYHGKKNVCGQRVRELRKERKITQTEFAARLQICDVWLDQKAISRIELEDRVVGDYELWAMATVLQVDMKELLQSMPVIELPEQMKHGADAETVQQG